ncbi:MAG TPA: purine-nucleoside phosphorylase [bacterium]|nr:purine-nucleoside phosphorylase [bacterium]
MDLSNYFQQVDEAANWLSGRVKIKPEIAVVLSGGLGDFADGLSDREEITSSDVPHFPRARAEGHSGKLLFGRHVGVPVVAMVGRFHFYEGHSPQAVVFPCFVLSKLGVKTLVTTNAVGGVNADFAPGDVMLVEDHINMMGMNPLIGLAIQRKTDQFTGLTNAYDGELRAIAEGVATKQGLPIKKGVYLATSGPSYETKAEIRAFRQMGADAVGMSTVPEIIAANFLGMRCLTFSCIANPAADLHAGTMNHAEVLSAMNSLAPKVVSLLRGVVEEIGKAEA